MDRETLLRYLAQAERHIVVGEQQITRQRDLIDGLERGGHDLTRAREVLQTLEHSQTLHVAHRDRILGQLEEKMRCAAPAPGYATMADAKSFTASDRVSTRGTLADVVLRAGVQEDNEDR
jgi:hypothetical protein